MNRESHDNDMGTSLLKDNCAYQGAAQTCGVNCEVKKTKAYLPGVLNTDSQSLIDQAGRKAVALYKI